MIVMAAVCGHASAWPVPC